MTTLNAMRNQRDILALENNTGNSTMNSLSSLVNSFTGFANITSGFSVSTTAGTITLNSNQRDFLTEIQKLSFRDMEQLTAYVPEGLNVTYGEYVLHLNATAEYCEENTMQILTTLATYISNLINNEHALLETHTFVTSLGKLEKERSVLNASIAKCFKKGSTIAATTVGKVISRNSDWKPLFEEVTMMNKTIDSVDKNKLYKKMGSVNELLDVFKRKFENGEIKDMSPEVSQNISNLLYQAASELEFFSVTFFRILGLTTSVNRTTDYIKQMFKR